MCSSDWLFCCIFAFLFLFLFLFFIFPFLFELSRLFWFPFCFFASFCVLFNISLLLLSLLLLLLLLLLLFCCLQLSQPENKKNWNAIRCHLNIVEILISVKYYYFCKQSLSVLLYIEIHNWFSFQ